KGADDLGRDARTVDGEEHGDLRRGGAEPGDDTGDRRSHARAVVDDLERKLAGLADEEDLVARSGENTAGTFDEHLSVELGERLRRAEAGACAADQHDARQSTIRHGSE